MAEVFRKNGIEVGLFRIENTNPSLINPSHALCLAFPVAVQSTYRFIWDFFKGLPPTEGTEAFMVDTLHSYSGAMVGPLKKILTRKGYKTIGAKEIRMPSNLYPCRIDEASKNKKIEKGLNAAKAYAEDILCAKTRWKRIAFLSDLFYFIVSRDWLWNFIAGIGKKFIVSRDTCTKCGLCSKLCPVGNIEMDEYPLFKDRCQQCMRCLMFYPSQAIKLPFKKFQQYRAVKAADLIGEGTKND